MSSYSPPELFDKSYVVKSRIQVVVEADIVDGNEEAAMNQILMDTLGAVQVKDIHKDGDVMRAVMPMHPEFFGQVINSSMGFCYNDGPICPVCERPNDNPPPYEYDWSKGKTTDPRLSVLPRGDAAPRVFLDGVKMNGRLVRVISGENGLVEQIAVDEQGKRITKNGYFVREWLRGKVEVDISMHYVTAGS